MIIFDCPSCSRRCSVVDELGGAQLRCKICGVYYEVPQVEDSSEETESALGRSAKVNGASVSVLREAMTCRRCGNFVAASAGSIEALECDECRGRYVRSEFSLNRDNWTIYKVLNHSWEVFTSDSNWQVLSLAFFIQSLVSSGLRVLRRRAAPVLQGSLGLSNNTVVIVSATFSLVVTFALLSGIFQMCFEVLENRRPKLSMLFGQFRRAWTVLGMFSFLLFLPVFAKGIIEGVEEALMGGVAGAEHEPAVLVVRAGSLLSAFVYGFYVWFPVCLFAWPALVDREDLGASGLVFELVGLSRGQRLKLLGLAIVALIVGFGGLLVCGFGVLCSMPLAILMVATAYRALRNGRVGEAEP